MSSAVHRTFTQYKPIDQITLSHIHQMHLVHQHTRPEVSLDDFITHMCGQSGAVLVRRRSDRLIVGFSTLRMSRQRRGRTLAHGPLVIHDSYRQGRGHARMLQWVTWLERCKNPFSTLQVVRADGVDALPVVTPERAAAQATLSRARLRHALHASTLS
ncbi:hypothetical protein [Aquabacterium sp.]|uniref:hypothetical protein n=1 Tax=Aquabacterium sp. TaxID=1872578 RepID=UPI0035B3AD89